MESHTTENGGSEFGIAGSTQTLGLTSTSSSTALFKNNKRIRLVLITLCFVLLAACIVLSVFLVLNIRKEDKHGEERDGVTCPKSAQQCSSETCLEVASKLQKSMNETVNPCEDFFQYSCGSWIKNNPIPSSEGKITTAEVLKKQVNEQILFLLLEDASGPKENAVSKARVYFKSCMKEDDSNNNGTIELKRLIYRFGSWSLDNGTWNESRWSYIDSLRKIHSDFFSISPLFELYIRANPYNSSRMSLKITPPRLSLLRDQYFATDNKTRLAYLKYMTKVGELLGGGNNTSQQMEDVMELEKELAKITPPKRELYANMYKTMNISDLESKAPGLARFTWEEYFNDLLRPFNLWINASDQVIVPSPEYLRNLSYVINGTDKRTLSNYMMWTLVRSFVPYLSRDYREALLEYDKEIQGTKTAKPRWLHCIEELNSYYHGLTFAVGYMWIKNVFDKDIIPFIEEMMTNIRAAFKEETKRYEWIDEQTRKKIVEKEIAMKNKIGFPELCANETLLNSYYENLSISTGNYFVNALDVMKWQTRSFLSTLKTPVDKEQWFTGPQLVNAFYLPNTNEINILAGILQPPFYYGRKAPRAVNFGAIGMVLAHELSHGFDASGRHFNKEGEIIDNWWSNYTSQGFNTRAQCMVDQYNKYPVDGGNQGQTHIDGKLTLSENIADNGGIRLAYWGYKNWLKKNGGKEALLPGLDKTNEQLLFISFAQMWCSSFRPSAAYHMAKEDTHTLANYRVIGSLSNLKEFSEAFKCPLGKGMNPEKKCQVW
ncbi:hypothetical protein ABFA07_002968 [Porites harrisoni]